MINANLSLKNEDLILVITGVKSQIDRDRCHRIASVMSDRLVSFTRYRMVEHTGTFTIIKPHATNHHMLIASGVLKDFGL